MIVTCPICSKSYDVLWPQLWAYKRGRRYLCSWSCLRIFDGKEDGQLKEQRRDRIEVAKNILEMYKVGKSSAEIFEYLRSIGYKNPTQAVHDIKSHIRVKAPELYEQWPVRINGKQTTIGESMKEETQEPAPVVKLSGPIRIETPEANMVDVVETPEKPEPDRYQVTAIRVSELGEFYHDIKYHCVDWRAPGGEEVSLSPEMWRTLAREIPFILQKVGASK